MERSKASTTSLSTSRSKRSSTNLSNLRLAPLSSIYVNTSSSATKDDAPAPAADSGFTRSHPSYLQGKSAPTTPGILSRSSSRRKLHGLSRRSSVYDNDEVEEMLGYEYLSMDGAGSMGAQTSNRPMQKAKSEAALLVQKDKLVPRGSKSPDALRKRHHSRRSTGPGGGSVTPKGTGSSRLTEDNWIMRTGMAANAIVQESKGQSWMSSRPSSTSFQQHVPGGSDGEEDEGYEEMAALSSGNTARLRQMERESSNAATTTRSTGWGSRYGSRTGSRRTSRRGSFTSVRTPLAGGVATQDGSAEYFDGGAGTSTIEPDFVDLEEEELDSQDEAAIDRMVDGKTFGLGGLVDRLMNFNLFKVEEKEDGTDDEGRRKNEQAEGDAVPDRQKRLSKNKQATPSGGSQDAAQGESGWSDAAWLASVAVKALF